MPAPFLREVLVDRPPDADATVYPWNLPALDGIRQVTFTKPISFFVGENGSGKSTLLTALAEASGFNPEGGGYSARFSNREDAVAPLLSSHLKLRWLPRARDGFFLRADSLYNLATYVDQLVREGGTYDSYGGRSLHEQSHGEALLALFTDRFVPRRPALFLLDEPETALSGPRQLALLRILHDHEARGLSQFIIATHSPILLGYPGALLLSFDRGPLAPIAYQDTDAYQIYRAFMTHRQEMLQELWRDDD